MINGMLVVGSGAAATGAIQSSTTLESFTSTTGIQGRWGVANAWVDSASPIGSISRAGPVGSTWVSLYTGTGTYTAGETGGRADKTLAAPVDITTIHDIGFYGAVTAGNWNVASNAARFYQINLWLGSDGDKSFTNSVKATYTLTAQTWPSKPTVKFLKFSRTDFSTEAGAFDWSGLQDVRIELFGSNGTVGAAAGTSAPVLYFQGLKTNNYTTPTVVITHDDGVDTTYSVGMAALAGYGWKSTQFVLPDEVGNAGRMTLAQLQELYAAGHDICMHATSSGDVLSTLTLAAIATEITTGLSWMTSSGFDNSKHIVSWPGGVVNASGGEVVFDTFVDAGITVGRGSNLWYNSDEWSTADTDNSGKNNKAMNLFIQDYDTATTKPADNMHDQLARLMKYGGIQIMNFHQVVTSGAAGPAINLADYTAGLDILKNLADKGLIQVKTMSEVFDTDGSLLI